MAFLLTSFLFGTALFVSNYFNERRVQNVRTIQENMAIDILSLETQFQLLQELSCKDIKENSVLSREVANLSARLSYTEGQLGSDNEEVLRLKRQYSLLQIKDMLLMKRVSQKCKLEPVFILYFYSNKKDCPECVRQGLVLTALSEKYPRLRIYSFDYNLDVPALNTLIKISDVTGELPVLVINEKVVNGFQSVADVEKLIPEIQTLVEKVEPENTPKKK